MLARRLTRSSLATVTAWPPDPERRSVGSGLDLATRTMRERDLLHDVEPKAKAVARSRTVSVREWIEDLFADRFGNRWAVARHFGHDVMVRVGTQLDRILTVMDRVRQ